MPVGSLRPLAPPSFRTPRSGDPESITTKWGYGFRVRSLRSRPGMTTEPVGVLLNPLSFPQNFPNERTKLQHNFNTEIRVSLVRFFFPCSDGMPCSIEGALMRRHVGGA